METIKSVPKNLHNSALKKSFFVSLMSTLCQKMLNVGFEQKNAILVSVGFPLNSTVETMT